MSEIQNESEVKRDEALDLQGLMSNTTPITDEGEKETTSTTNVDDLLSNSSQGETSVKKESMSEIEKAMNNSQQTGFVSTQEEIDRLEKEARPQALRHMSDTDERREETEEKANELLSLSEKAKKLLCIRKPTNQGEDALMIDELDRIIIKKDGKIIMPEDARYFIPKPNDFEMKRIRKEYEEAKEEDKNAEEPIELRSSELTEEKIKELQDRKNQINIIIDKTGLGTDVVFNELESKLITEATEIHVTEVENMELETMEVEYEDDDDDLSFMEDVDKYQLSVSKTNMAFPASGFKADMFGLSFGELSDITLDVINEDSEDMLDFDKIYKKCAVVYRKMKNISRGEFKDFDEFLHKFAFVDLPLATYGLYISTQSEEDQITLVCHKESCNTRFLQKFHTRSIIDFNSCGNKYLEMLKKISMASSREDYIKIAEEADVNHVKKMKLSESQFIVEVGPISLYDYLYKVLKVINDLREEQRVADEEGKEFDSSIGELSYLLQVVRAINIPKGNGKYKRITNPHKIIDILAHYTPPKDIQLLNSIYVSCQSKYGVDFSVKNARCPKCGSLTARIPVLPDELVFYIRQRFESTNVIVDNFQ